MKAFFQQYSYTMVKLFVNQFAIAIFGFSLALASAASGNRTLQMFTSVFSVIFCLFLQYAVMWEVGAKDGIRAEARKTSRGLWRGVAIAAVANSINILLALFTLLGVFCAPGTVGFGIGGGARVIALFLEGMYMGILSQPFRGLHLFEFSWAFFAICVPSILVCSLAYILGSYNLHATNILIPKNKDVKNNGRHE